MIARRLSGTSVVLLAGMALLGVITVTLGVAFADTTGGGGTGSTPMPVIGMCCNPVHAATPTAPAGSGSVCSWDNTLQKCTTSDSTKCGNVTAWQDVIAAACQNQTNATCTANAVTTNVTIYRGTWGCYTKPNSTDCPCTWAQDYDSNGNPVSDTKTNQSNCTGSACN